MIFRENRNNSFACFASGAVLSLGLVLVGCGGGGDAAVIAPPVAGTTNGTAAKGIIKNGVVVANELDVNSDVIAQVGSATTDGNGEYQITIDSSYAGGPIQIKLTDSADTTMVCDVKPDCGSRTDGMPDTADPSTVDFGEDMQVPNLNMEALIGQVSSGEILSVNITPFTTMAANRAFSVAAGGVMDASVVNDANSSVSNLLGGLDIIRLKPVNLADPAALAADSTLSEQITYAILSAAVGQLAFSGDGSIEAALEKLAESFTTGTISADSGTSATYSLEDIVTASSNQFALQGLVDETGVLTDLQQDILAAGTGGSITPSPSPDAGNTDIAKAKALIQEIRTWGVQLDSLGASGDVFADEVALAAAASDPMINSVTQSLAIAADLMFVTLDSASGNGSYPYNGATFGGTGSGNVTINDDGSRTTISIDGTVNTDTVNLTAIVNPSIDAAVSSLMAALSGEVVTTGAVSGGEGVLLIITDGVVNASFDPSIDLSTISTATDIESSLSEGSFSLGASLEQLNPASGNPVRFSGLIGMSAQRATSGLLVDFIPTQASLSGTLSNNTSSVEATINATISNADEYDPFSPESATNTLKGVLSASMTVDLADLPSAQLTITADRTGFDPVVDLDLGDISLTLSHDGNTTRAEITNTSASSVASGNLTFTNTSGAQLALTANEGDIQGDLKVGSATVGTVTELGDGIIKVSYNDGTFETLN